VMPRPPSARTGEPEMALQRDRFDGVLRRPLCGEMAGAAEGCCAKLARRRRLISWGKLCIFVDCPATHRSGTKPLMDRQAHELTILTLVAVLGTVLASMREDQTFMAVFAAHRRVRVLTLDPIG
jgi:hypothetical protein